MSELLHKGLSFQIRGPRYEVYNGLGPGFREETYKRATLAALARQGIPVQCEWPVEVHFMGEAIDTYRLDIVVDGKVILELKAVDELHPRHPAQLHSYLRASGLRLGLLVNFGTDRLEVVRKVL